MCIFHSSQFRVAELQQKNKVSLFLAFFFIAQLCYQFVSLATQQKHLVAHFLINHHYKTADQLQTKLIIILCNASYYIHKHFIFAIFSRCVTSCWYLIFPLSRYNARSISLCFINRLKPAATSTYGYLIQHTMFLFHSVQNSWLSLYMWNWFCSIFSSWLILLL